ncbi:MAG: 50S ribosomal protein L11 methyltransferase [Muribaculaceae bacterium]|nr:50S ribosomal protein L11 methyltransferase [Muribaculaceae bacterium]
MNNYYEVVVTLSLCSETAADILAAILAPIGFESFVADETGVTAYIREADWDRQAIDNVLAEFPLPDVTATISRADLIPGQDWNSEWEKNYFKPIVVDDKCVIHSSFHVDYPTAQYDIVIDPKMAFGTGHHATTSLILEQLLSMDFDDRTSVLDMGTGTGILAILTAMKGAGHVAGIEIDEAAYQNALENVALNNVPSVKLYHGDASLLTEVTANHPVDLFIANINRNVITADIDRYAATMRPGATMLLSGFYEEDIPVVAEAADRVELTVTGHSVKDRWTCLRLVKQ